MGKRYRVTLIPGDGIGPEVTQAAMEVVAAAGIDITWDRLLAGASSVEAGGEPLPEALIRSLRRNRVALKGPLDNRRGDASDYPGIEPVTSKAVAVKMQTPWVLSRRGQCSPPGQRYAFDE
jgi:isocitrate/isopropylmalate dehydrogenase